MKAMKKQIIGLILFIGAISSTFGQSNYTFTKAAGIYSPLSSPTVVSSSEGWNDEMLMLDLGTTINFMGTQTDRLLILEGQIMNYGTFNASGQFSLSETPMLNAAGVDLIDKAGEGATSSLSPISYNLSGNSGSYILKVEFKDVAFEEASDLASNTASFQIWYYESNQKVEYHYGNSSFTEWAGIASGNMPEGMQVSLTSSYNYNGQTGTFLFLDGDEAIPTAQDATLSPSNIPTLSLNQFPTEGTIYRFETSGTSIGTLELKSEISVNPNPAINHIYLDIPIGEHLSIYNINGQEVWSQKYIESGISISQLSTGIYVLKSNTGQSRFVKL